MIIFTNRIKVLSALVVVLSVVAFFAVRKKNTVATFETSLALSLDTGSINTISFGQNVLSRNLDGRWLINNKFETRNQLTSLLIFGVSRLEIKRPVSEDLKEQVISKIKKDGFKVTIEDELGGHSFFVMTNENDSNSSYFLSDDSDVPYIVYVPGYTGDISNLFGLSEADWRSRLLFASNYRSLQNIKVEYPLEPNAGFSIKYKEGNFELSDLPAVDTLNLVSYLEMFENLNISGFPSLDEYKVNQLNTTKPLVSVSVEDINEKYSNTLLIYPIKKDEDYFYGKLLNGDEIVLIRAETANKLMKKKSYFAAR